MKALFILSLEGVDPVFKRFYLLIASNFGRLTFRVAAFLGDFIVAIKLSY
jgi:hypothetical protein